MMRFAIVLLMAGMLSGCGFSEYKAKEDTKTKLIVKAISDSKSTVAGMTTTEALSIVLVASGKYVKIGGWACDKNIKDGSYDVWLDLTINDNPGKLHWVVDAGNNLSPANDLAQKVTVQQKLKL